MTSTANQNNPVGYKQTEIGVIPEDWDIEPIKQLATITTGSKNTQDRVHEGLYPFFVRSQTIERINSYSYDGEAILTAGDGVGTGKVFHYINGKFDIHQRVYKISDFNKKLNGYFFFLYFSNNFFNRIMQMTAKSSVDSVRMEMIADMQIPVPTKAEQSAIATTLSDTDTLIKKLEKLIEKKKNIKQGVMQELLTGKRRLTGFSGKWEIKKLGKECDLITKGTTPTSIGKEFKHSGVKFIKVESLQKNGTIIADMVAYIDEDTHKLLNRSQLKENDLLISIAGALGRVGIVKKWILPANTNQALAIVRLKDGSNFLLNYLFYFLKTEKIEKYIEGISVQGAQANLSLQNIFDLPIEYPNKPEQSAIAQVLSDMDAEIEKLESQLTKYRNLKQGMMQILLTGKIRLIKK